MTLLSAERKDRSRWAQRAGLGAVAAVVVCTAVAGVWSVLSRSGEPAVPLDDTYIHFQYARSFAEWRPLSYTPGAAPTPGATSWLWPSLFAPFLALGVEGASLIWVAWCFGLAAYALLVIETWQAARALLPSPIAVLAAALSACFGAHIWFALSGMTVVPLGWLLLRTARRAADMIEAPPPASNGLGLHHLELAALAVAGPLLRPEGALASLLVFIVFVTRKSSQPKLLSIVALSAPALPPLLNYALTGSALSTTAEVKWLVTHPGLDGRQLLERVFHNVRLLFGTLLNGEKWTTEFLPAGCAPVAWLALPGLWAAGVHSGKRARVVLLSAVALGMLVPTSYDSFLWNRVRYIWPFAAAWLIGVACVADGLGRALSKLWPRLLWLGPVAALGVVIGLASKLAGSIEDLAESSAAITHQQVSLGRWARRALPRDSVIGLNDAGAIAYYSNRSTFDIVGLTTRGEAPFWVAGAGSRFEHYERLDRRLLPTHFIVYPRWLAAPPLLGKKLTERTVEGATILGGTTMEAHLADYSTLHSGSLPSSPPPGALLDALDVADLDGERDHRFGPGGTQLDNVVVYTLDGTRADGARDRRLRDEFELVAEGAGTLVMRLGAAEPVTLQGRAGAARFEVLLTDARWQEARVTLPRDLTRGRIRIKIEAPRGQRFSSSHYWSYAAASSGGT